jgi:hypothetical protein
LAQLSTSQHISVSPSLRPHAVQVSTHESFGLRLYKLPW